MNVRNSLISRAFTLIELLVVLSIVGVLLSIVIVAVGRAKSAAKKATCISNLRTLGIAGLAYRADHKNSIAPLIMSSNPNQAGQWWSGSYHWDYEYGKYLQGDVKFISGNSGYQEPVGAGWGVFKCPTDENVRTVSVAHLPPRSYGIFSCLIEPMGDGAYVNAASVPRPSSTYWIADLDMSDSAYRNAVCGRASNAYDGGGGSVVYIDRGKRVGAPHGGGANILFLDGHVQNLRDWAGRASNSKYPSGSDVELHLKFISE